jgi:glycosyltransferase involved in cell wall biosynthesis
LAAGTPVVVTDKCGVAEIVTNKMGLVVSDDPRSVAAALDRLLGDRQLRKNMKAHLNTVAQSMTWDQPLDVMESMLHSLVDRTVTDGQWEHA